MSVSVISLRVHPVWTNVVAGWLHGQWAHRRGESLEGVRRRLAERLAQEGPAMTWVALEDGLPVGTASLVPEDNPIAPGTLPCLGDLFVAPGRRGRGAGTALCRQALAHARQAGLGPLFTLTVDRASFFLERGWQPIAETVVPAGGDLALACFLRQPAGPA